MQLRIGRDWYIYLSSKLNIYNFLVKILISVIGVISMSSTEADSADSVKDDSQKPKECSDAHGQAVPVESTSNLAASEAPDATDGSSAIQKSTTGNSSPAEFASASDATQSTNSANLRQFAISSLPKYRLYYFQAQQIPRLSCKDSYCNKLISMQQPVVITDTNVCGPALTWSLEYLRDHIGDGNFMLCESNDYRFVYFDEKKIKNVKSFVIPHKRSDVKFNEFYDKLKKWKPGKPRLYLQQALNDSVGPRVVKDFLRFNWDWANGQQKRNKWSELTSNLLLVSQEGNITPAHFDEQENFLAQISGSKRALLFSPAHFANLYPYPYYHPCDRQSQVDFENPDFTRFPRAADVHPVEAILNPGDVLYIPPYWWHQVESALDGGPTISLTFWYKCGPVGKIEYPLKSDQKVAIMRNIEKMIMEALNDDEAEINEFFRNITLGRFVPLPVSK